MRTARQFRTDIRAELPQPTAAAATEAGVSISAAAAHLGVAPETLRSWGRRYGIAPSARTAGGHRRFSSDDLARLARMQQLIAAGAGPSHAARRALAEPAPPHLMGPVRLPAAGSSTKSTKQGRPRVALAGPKVPGAPAETCALARALAKGRHDAARGMVRDLLAEGGAARLWDAVAPLWTALGDPTDDDGPTIGRADYLSVIVTGLREHRACQAPPMRGRAVVLAGWPHESDDLPLHVVAAGLAEQRIPVRLAGVREPVSSFLSAAANPPVYAVFLWRRHLADAAARRLDVPRRRSPLRLVVGGPGWDGVPLPAAVRRTESLRQATGILRATVC